MEMIFESIKGKILNLTPGEKYEAIVNRLGSMEYKVFVSSPFSHTISSDKARA